MQTFCKTSLFVFDGGCPLNGLGEQLTNVVLLAVDSLAFRRRRLSNVDFEILLDRDWLLTSVESVYIPILPKFVAKLVKKAMFAKQPSIVSISLSLH
jgi:hypothetical protein